jgi:glutathione synthase/RimK-type ligase-like ATP-grasp enzyme
LYAAIILEALGKNLINPLHIEHVCQSKIRTLLTLWRNNVNIPNTVYIPANVHDYATGGVLHDNTRSIADLITNHLEGQRIVVKPDSGTHGSGVSLADNHKELEILLSNVEPSIINLSGVVAQELVPKWFYDMRIIVSKEKGKQEFCPSTCLVRAGFKDFRTNTFLGNMVFRLRMPQSVRKASAKAAKVLAGSYQAWVIALDAMPYLSEENMVGEPTLRSSFNELAEYFNVVQKVKAIKDKKVDFIHYSDAITDAYKRYMDSTPYKHIQGVIEDTLKATQDKVVFHEGNSCPEFWEQTRVVGGINVAGMLLNSAKSLI